jgi:AcrR family transcriptional regulator
MEASAQPPAFTRLDPEGRRRQILEAANRVFSEQPYASVSMRDIAQAAGVTRGLIHHYFGSKSELFREVVRSLAGSAPSLVRIDPELPIEQLAAANVDAWLDFTVEHRELALTIGAGALHPDDPALQTIVDETREQVIDRIILNHTGSTEAPPPVRFIVRSYLGLADAAAREWLYHRRATRAEVHTMLVRSLLAIMRDTLPALLEAGSPKTPAPHAR